MSKIDQLIKKYCPDGVEFKKLMNLTTDRFWIMPSTPRFNTNEDVPYITSKNIKKGNIDFAKVKYISRYDFLNLSRNRPIIVGDILISMIGTIGEVAEVKVCDPEFYGQNMFLIRLDNKKIYNKYFLHYFDSIELKQHFNSIKNKSSQGYLRAGDIEDIKIPLPPIEVQQEIINILDKFTELQTELEAELEARRKQYEYYRNKLLTFRELGK